MCLYQPFISRFTHTFIYGLFIPDCFLIFWFCIKGNQVYCTWNTYTPVLLVSIQLLFSHCVKYAQIQAFSDPYFPVCGQNHIRIFPYLDRISNSVQKRVNTDTILSIYRKFRIRESPYLGIFHTVREQEFCRIWTESYPYFPVFGQNQRFCLNTGKYGYKSAHIWENTNQRKPVFWHISCSLLLDIFSRHLNIGENISFASAKIARK